MKHFAMVSMVVATAAAVAFGGSVYAFADWIVIVPPTVLKMRAAPMPAGNAPSVAKNGKNTAIDWVGTDIVSGVKAESYVVTRFGAGDPTVVCDHVVTTTACKDKSVPGGMWTWKVQPVFKNWIGDYSSPSVALTFGGPPPAAELVSATSPAAPATSPAPSAGTPIVGVPSQGGDATVVNPPPALVTASKSPVASESEETEAPPPVVKESNSAPSESSVAVDDGVK